MSKLLMPVTPLAGHVNPLLAIGAYLHRQGHEVLFNTSELFRERVEACELRFVPLIGNANYDYRQLGELIPGVRAAVSHIDLYNIYAKHLFGDRIPDQYWGIRQILDSEDVDLVITEAGFWGILPLVLRTTLRPPVLSCGTVAPMWHDPSFSVLTGPDDTPKGIVRNIEHSRQWRAERTPGHSYVDEVLEDLGVQVSGGFDVSDTQYRLPDLFLQLGAEEFEFPRHNRMANLRWVGPILPEAKGTTAPGWLEALDNSRAVVFVTQGTLANFDFNQLVNPTVAAMAGEDVQVIVTAGGGPVNTITAPENVIVEAYLPYELILPYASVFVTNGGYNGVQQALSYGVPIVSAGESEDKLQVCARVAWSRVGINLRTGAPTPTQIRDAVFELLRDPSYRERSKKIGASIARTNALATIARIVEVTIAQDTKHKTWSGDDYRPGV